MSEIIGYNTIGISSGNISASHIIVSARSAPSVSGTVESIELYSSNVNASLDMKVGIYEDNGGVPGALIGTSSEFTDTGTWSVGWKLFGGLNFSVTGGIYYWLVAQASANFVQYYNTIAGTNRHWNEVTAYGNPWPDPFSSSTSSGAKYSIRATVTAAGGSAIPVFMHHYLHSMGR